MIGITSSIRQGIYLIFIYLMVIIGTFFLNMSMFENLLIIVLVGIMLKLTDIEEKLS